uniref:Fe2OG dioxygenase domain-containing protein n=2 Tax=Hemiselmis andersenii TaxID=464988 RepID=A0A7S1E545_HEMAN|mmetsp:Transcript_36944/g.89689  ORF Transcript_36944/g.89689 Transcript_36944/m.89689 type:complete len:346 (+) Transcript_36944:83-1120(+)
MPHDAETTVETLPVIDISSFTFASAHTHADRDITSKKWDKAMTDVGFALITGHGVSAQTVDDMRAGATQYFTQSGEEKARDIRGPYGCPDGGYTAMGAEAVGRTRDGHGADGGNQPAAAATKPPDLVESYVFKFREKFPEPPQMAAAAATYALELQRVLASLHEMSAQALGLPLDFFSQYYRTPGDLSTLADNCSMRLAYYPPLDAGQVSEGGGLRYGEHTDYTGFTILHQDADDLGELGSGGLEVKLPSGDFHAVRPVKGSFVVNIGDLYQVWTNDRWKSTVHRVARPSRPCGARISIPFFTGPFNDATISAIPTCVADGEHPKHAPTKVFDHLMRKVAASQIT